MTTLQIYLTMAALGVAVCLAFVGMISYRHHRTLIRISLGIVSGGLVATSPFIISMMGSVDDALLSKSLLLSLVMVLGGTLIYTLSRWPVKDHSVSHSRTHDPSRIPVLLSAEDPNKTGQLKMVNSQTSAKTLPTLIRSAEIEDELPTLELELQDDEDIDRLFDISDEDLFHASESTSNLDQQFKDDFDIDAAFASSESSSSSSQDPDPLGTIAANDDANADDVAIDNSVIFDLTGQHDIPTEVGVPVPVVDDFELSAPEEPGMEETKLNDSVLTEIEMFDNDIEQIQPGPGTHETQSEFGFDESNITVDETDSTDVSDHGVLADALVDNVSTVDHTISENTLSRSTELNAAIQDKLAELDHAISSLDMDASEQADENAVASDNESPSDPAIDAESFDMAESDVQTATATLVKLQHQILEQNQQQELIINRLKEQSIAERLKQKEETARIRELLKGAAELTREAGSQQQALLEVAEHEMASRQKSETSAKNALDIARTAMDRLAKARSPTNGDSN